MLFCSVLLLVYANIIAHRHFLVNMPHASARICMQLRANVPVIQSESLSLSESEYGYECKCECECKCENIRALARTVSVSAFVRSELIR